FRRVLFRSPAMDQKALSTSTSSDGTKPASWRRFFASFLLNMGKRSASTPNGRLWTAPCCKPRRALKKSATEGLGRNPTDRGRSGGKKIGRASCRESAPRAGRAAAGQQKRHPGGAHGA